MKYVLDTNVVSALRTPKHNPQVATWVASRSIADLYIAAMTVAEIGLGVAARERKDPAVGAHLRRWFETAVLPAVAGRILPFDRAAALILSGYRVPEHAPYDDALIAAVAQANNATVVTRNTKHFVPLGVPVINPWEA